MVSLLWLPRVKLASPDVVSSIVRLEPVSVFMLCNEHGFAELVFSVARTRTVSDAFAPFALRLETVMVLAVEVQLVYAPAVVALAVVTKQVVAYAEPATGIAPATLSVDTMVAVFPS